MKCKGKEALKKSAELMDTVAHDAADKTTPHAERPMTTADSDIISQKNKVGGFGRIFTEFKGNYQAAKKALMEAKDGDAIAALRHRELGDIDLVWGKEGTGKSDGYGLSKLIKHHPEVVDKLDKIIYDMPIISKSKNRVILQSDKYQAGVRLDWDGESKQWLLTAFERRNSNGNVDFTHTLQNYDEVNKIVSSTVASKRIISQKNWENKVDKWFAEGAEAYRKGEEFVLDKIPLNPIKNILSVKRAAKQIYEITNDFRTAQIQMSMEAKQVREFIDNSLSFEDKKILFRVMDGIAPISELPSHLKGMYDKFRTLIDGNADALVDAGALGEKYKIKDYMKRFYQDYIEKNKEAKKIFFEKYKARNKELTEDDRIMLGMIDDPAFTISNTLLAQKTQILKANMLKNIADKFGGDTPFEGGVRVSDETAGGGIKRYGALAGKYIPQDIADGLFGAEVLKRELSHAADASVKLMDWWTKAVDHIKVNVTVKNPMTHIYNIGSNISLSFLHGDMVEVAKLLRMRITDPSWFKALAQRGNKQGLNSYLGEMENDFFDGLKPKKEDGIAISILKNIYFAKGSKSGDFMRRLYDWEDKIFKLAHFNKKIREGMDDKSAMKLAQEAYVDYTTPLPGVVRTLDKSGLMPFLHYTYKATPMVAKTIIKHPVKFAMLSAAVIGSGASAWLDNDKQNVVKPSWAQNTIIANLYGVDSWWELPFADGWYWNLGRLVPGVRFDGFDLIPGGFLRGVLDIAHGKSTLGYAIDKEDDNLEVKIFKRVAEMAKSYLPSMTIGRYGQQIVGKVMGLNPPENAYGEEMGYDEIFLRALGVRRFNEEKELITKQNASKKRFEKELKKAENNDEREKARDRYKFDLELYKESKEEKPFSFWK